jgi:HAMP domain-containing protein
VALPDDEATRLNFVNNLRVFALLGTFAAALLINYFSVSRRALRSVAALQAGADAIGAGDDEIGDLARSFNRMATDLETVTASRPSSSGRSPAGSWPNRPCWSGSKLSRASSAWAPSASASSRTG